MQAAGLGWELLSRAGRAEIAGLRFQPAAAAFPALTCPAQAAFRCAASAPEHGMPANGFLDRRLRRVFFWEQSAALVNGPRFWERFRAAGGTVAMLFWQQSLGEAVDFVLSPRPIHRHGGGMIQDCYSRPQNLYAQLTRRIGRPFDLMRYWGPLAGRRSSEWIAAATIETMRAAAPDLLLTYLPHLDYDLQRFGPNGPEARRALDALAGWLERLRAAARDLKYELLVFGDYALAEVREGPVFPNRILREAGLLDVRQVRGRAYADLFGSAAFAVADHEWALVYARDDAAAARARSALSAAPGVAEIVEPERFAAAANPARAADFALLAAEGRWFAYPWWSAEAEAPDYASHVDIHNKPGYDPCELFFGWPPFRIGRDPARVRGTHGRVGPGREIAWACSANLAPESPDVIGIARALRHWLGAGIP